MRPFYSILLLFLTPVWVQRTWYLVSNPAPNCRNKCKTTTAWAAWISKMIPGAFPEPCSLGRGSRGWAGSKRDRLPAGRDGSFGQGLLGGGARSPGEPAHLVVLVGCWGEGFMGSSEKLPEPRHGVAITLGRKGQLAPERGQGYLPTAAPNSRGLALVGNDTQAPPALPWQGQSQGQAGRSDLAWGWPSLTRGELFWRGCCRLGWTQGF